MLRSTYFVQNYAGIICQGLQLAPNVYSRPGVYWLESQVYPWLLNGTSIYSSKYGIQIPLAGCLHNMIRLKWLSVSSCKLKFVLVVMCIYRVFYDSCRIHADNPQVKSVSWQSQAVLICSDIIILFACDPARFMPPQSAWPNVWNTNMSQVQCWGCVILYYIIQLCLNYQVCLSIIMSYLCSITWTHI